MKFARTLCTLIAAILMLGCSASMPPSQVPKPSPLVIASCPELTPLVDATFGATTAKLVEVAGQYHLCRAAALQGQP